MLQQMRVLAATAVGISLGLALGFGVAFTEAHPRFVNGVPRRGLRVESPTPDMKDALFDFPADFVPHRVVGRAGPGTRLLECDAFEFGWRLGLVYALGGAVLGVAFALGADASRTMATGLIVAALSSAL